MIPAQEALERLREGNQRFISGIRNNDKLTQARRSELASSQEPFAIILGCADSRVPAEMVFDQGFGDLFVVRVAGNIAASSQIGSIEFAAANFGTRLIVVLGHSSCGAVKATLNELEQPSENGSPHLGSIVESISPSLKSLLSGPFKDDPVTLLDVAIKENIRASVKQLRQESAILEQLIKDDGLKIVGAEYSLETGDVQFLEN